MYIDIIKGPGAAAARITMAPNEKCVAEAGALIAMRGRFDLKTSTSDKKRSIIGGLKRMLGGESFFLNHFTADSQGGELIFGAAIPGDMLSIELHGPGIIVEGGAFVLRSDGIEMELGWQGVKSIFAGEGLFWLKLSGRGHTVVNSFGAIYPVDIDGDFLVDTGHIVAFEESLKFSLTKAGKSWISSILGGEGLVCRFSGKGRIWCQSHHLSDFGGILGPLLAPKTN